jgi:hypothetical protein
MYMLSMPLHFQVEGLQGKAYHSSITLDGWLPEPVIISMWITMRMQNPYIQRSDDGTVPGQLLKSGADLPGYVLRPASSLTTLHRRQPQSRWQQQGSLSQSLPFVVEYDTNDNGKQRIHQREKDDEEEGQATQGQQWGHHLSQLHIVH